MRLLIASLLALLLSASAAEPGWLQPPPEILSVLHAPEPPQVWASPDHQHLMLADLERYPPLADVARPILRLAGVRFDPATRAPHGVSCVRSLSLRTLPRTEGEEETPRPVPLPEGACVLGFRWSADGARYALTLRAEGGPELWVGSLEADPRQVKKLHLNPLLGAEFQWMPDQRTLLVLALPADLGPPPAAPETPSAPRALETQAAGPSSTYEARDLLTSVEDEAQFRYWARSEIALVDADSRRVRPLSQPGLYASVQPSPDGQHLLVRRLQEPFSRRVAWGRFAHAYELWDAQGRLERTLFQLPAAEEVPIQGEPEGPRAVGWRQSAPATLVWLEALDGGDPARTAEHRDHLMTLQAPFSATPAELWRARHRIQGWWWGEDGTLLVEEYARERRWTSTWLLNADDPSVTPVTIMDHSAKDRYGDPGTPLTHWSPTGARLLRMSGDAIFLVGDGASAQGERPFVDRRSLRDGSVERLFRAAPGTYESLVDLLDEDTLLTRRESPTEPPNLQIRALGAPIPDAPAGEAQRQSTPAAVTHYADPTPIVRQVQKRLVTTTRADGVTISFKLYLPPGYQEGTRLPTVLTAYPFEYSDAATASQIAGSDQTFTQLRGTSPLFLVLSGYAVLSETSMPVIGDPETAYDSFVQQLVMNAEAAVSEATRLGVTDPERVGVWGHSHGALMVATLLAHSDIFRAGIARSGAYNHTIRPFGFQSERRTLWEAKQTYLDLSPVMFAPQINEPLLLIHGERDQNPGTVPLQSEKLYDAIRGTGGTARLLILPGELHGYVARESVEQVLAEQLRWFDAWVKEAPPRAGQPPR